MTKFKCDKCGCSPEFLWMFGGFGPTKDDDKEYCENCFTSRLKFFGLHVPKPELEQEPEEKENSLSA